MNKIFALSSLLAAAVLVSGCGNNGDFADLRDYIEETKRRPGRHIEPLPVFRPLPPFSYTAMTYRSPFERPVRELASIQGGRSVEPDLTRPKEFLENFSIANMRMVGTVVDEGKLWALIDTGQGSVESVSVGNYMGRNHGKIVTANPNQIEIMEIISDGGDGWVERPRIIKLDEKG